MLQQRLDFGGEYKRGTVPEVVKRLDAETVAGAEQSLRTLIPYREGKHTAELIETGRPIFFVSVHHHFGIGAGAVAVASLFERGAQIGMVEDFAVVDDPDVAGLVGERVLTKRREVDDA